MIKELRIGNWYNHRTAHDTQPCQVQAHIFGCDTDFWSRVSPVLVDEKWLRKFGFSEYEIGVHKETRSFKKFRANSTACYFSIHIGRLKSFQINRGQSDELIDHHVFNYEVKYIHQLQNIYYAFEGEELKFI